LFAVDEESARAAGGERAGFVGLKFIAHVHFAFRQLVVRGDRVQFQAKKAVDMRQSAAFDIKRKAAKKTGLGNNDTRGTAA
jgi:hypothetical protein